MLMKEQTRLLVLAGLFIALGLILPFFTAQVPPTIGRALLPMHIPVLLSGFVLGPPHVGFWRADHPPAFAKRALWYTSFISHRGGHDL